MDILKYNHKHYFAYAKLLRLRKGWMNSGARLGVAVRKSRDVDRQWYYGGARKAGSFSFARKRKAWKVWPWERP